jgi:hypothetical protein
MKFCPHGYVESGRAVVRVLAFCLIASAAVLLAAYITFYPPRSAFAHDLQVAYWDKMDGFLGLTAFTHDFLAALLGAVSLMLMFGKRAERDVRYGRIGLCIAVASMSIYFLPNPPKARGRADAAQCLVALA